MFHIRPSKLFQLVGLLALLAVIASYFYGYDSLEDSVPHSQNKNSHGSIVQGGDAQYEDYDVSSSISSEVSNGKKLDTTIEDTTSSDNSNIETKKEHSKHNNEYVTPNQKFSYDFNATPKEPEKLVPETKEAKKERETKELEAKSKERKERIAFLNDEMELLQMSSHIKIDVDSYKMEDKEDIDIVNGNKPFHDFMGAFFDVLRSSSKLHDHPDRELELEGKPYIENPHLYEQTDVNLNENLLHTLLHYSNDFIEDLHHKHYFVVSRIPDESPLKFYSGDGYVIVGGGEYSWLAYINIKMLRKTGSTLPVEVMIPTDEDYESEFCNILLPNLNAKCVLFSKVFGEKNLPKLGNLNGYQYKSLALLASSFLNTFLLDSDSFAVSNPDKLFKSELFEKFKMVTWPDFWRRTTSPYYYEVANIDVKDKQIRYLNDFYTSIEYIQKGKSSNEDPESFDYHNREGTIPDWTGESGELLINKKEHFNTLLLSLYYNFNGPRAYHPLLSQGGAGEGDKETFIAAATYYKKPYYQLYKLPEKIYGYYKDGQSYVDSTMVQYDPMVDFELLVKNCHRLQKEEKENESSYEYDTAYKLPFNRVNSKPMFYHTHDPKLDPFLIFERKLDRVKESDTKLRMMGHERINQEFDVELAVWEIIVDTLCEKKAKFECFTGRDLQKYCSNELPEHVEYLKATSNTMITDLGDIFSDNPKMQKIQKELAAYEMSQEEIEETKKFIYKKRGVKTFN